MRLSIQPLLVLSGLAVGALAQLTTSAAGVSVGFRSQLAATAQRLTVSQPAAEVVSSSPQVSAASSTGIGGLLQSLGDLSAEQIVGGLRQAFPNMDELAVLSAANSIDLAAVTQKYLLPIALKAMTTISKINGATIIDGLERLTGDSIIQMIKDIDLTWVYQALIDLKVVPLVKGLVGIDLTTNVEDLKRKTGETLLAEFELLTGDDVINLIASTGLLDLLSGPSFNIEPLLTSIRQLTGAQIVEQFRKFQGKALVDTVRSWDGTALADHINLQMNTILTQVRTATAVSLGLDQPEAFTGFDLFGVIGTLQTFMEELTGVAKTDIAPIIQQFNGNSFVEALRAMSLQDFVDSAAPMFKFLELPAYYISALLPPVDSATSTNASSFLDRLNGTDLVERVKSLNVTPLVEALEGIKDTPIAKAITAVDLTPYVDAVKAFDGARLVANFEVLTGDRVVQLMDDLKISEFLDGLRGFDFSPFTDYIRKFTGKEILDSLGAYGSQQSTVLAPQVEADVVDGVENLVYTETPVAAVTLPIQLQSLRLPTAVKVAALSTTRQVVSLPSSIAVKSAVTSTPTLRLLPTAVKVTAAIKYTVRARVPSVTPQTSVSVQDVYLL